MARLPFDENEPYGSKRDVHRVLRDHGYIAASATFIVRFDADEISHLQDGHFQRSGIQMKTSGREINHDNAKQAMILDLFVLLVPATADLTLGRFDNAAGGAIAVAVGFAVASAVCTTIETGGRSDNLGPLSWLTYEWMVRSFEDEARRRNEKGNERD